MKVENPEQGMLVSEMPSESDPILCPTQENATPEPPTAELSEIDKILIQDKLNERGRVRDALADTFRYAIIAVIGILSYLIGTKFGGPKNMKPPDLHTLMSIFPLLWLALFVLALAGSRTAHFLKRLETLNKELNTALGQFSRKVDDSDLSELAKKQWLEPLAILIAFLAVLMLASIFREELPLTRRLFQSQ